MKRQTVVADDGKKYEFVLDEAGALLKVNGDLPEPGGSFTLQLML